MRIEMSGTPRKQKSFLKAFIAILLMYVGGIVFGVGIMAAASSIDLWKDWLVFPVAAVGLGMYGLGFQIWQEWKSA